MSKTKIIWSFVSGIILMISLTGYDGTPNSDASEFLNLSMLILSFPFGLISIPLHVTFGSGIEVSYFYIVVVWLFYYLVGYFQWFKFPALASKIWNRLIQGYW